jgi:zinc/manganese transport system substrate-binding protein
LSRFILPVAVSLSLTLLLAQPAFAQLKVLACEPEWASLVQELAGDKASVSSATTALQDPHHIEARPSLIARARNADLVVCSGSELEVGWIPLLLTQSGNTKIQPGTPGFLETSQFVSRLEIPKVLDRSLGDIHPAGTAQYRQSRGGTEGQADADRFRQCGFIQIAHGGIPAALEPGDSRLGNPDSAAEGAEHGRVS